MDAPRISNEDYQDKVSAEHAAMWNSHFVAVLVKRLGGEVVIDPEEIAEVADPGDVTISVTPREATKAELGAPPPGWDLNPLEHGAVLTLVQVERPPEAAAVDVAPGAWIHAESGRAVQVVRTDAENGVWLQEEVKPGEWSEETRWHADCFLRAHVIADGVPLL